LCDNYFCRCATTIIAGDKGSKKRQNSTYLFEQIVCRRTNDKRQTSDIIEGDHGEI